MAGFIIVNNSSGELGTLLIYIFRPSVDPIPIDANDLMDVMSENILVEPESLNIYEPDRAMDGALFGATLTSILWWLNEVPVKLLFLYKTNL